MRQVVFVSTSEFQAPRDRLAEFLTSVALVAAVVGAGMSGYNSGGVFWGLLFAFVTFITFPFLLAFGTIFFLALYPLLALPGSWLASQLGWTFSSSHALKRIWLQRASVVVLLIPLVVLLQRNALSIMGLIAGVATFGLLLVGMLLVVPVLLLTGLFLYALSRDRYSGDRYGREQYGAGGDSTVPWTPPEPPRLPPPE